MLLKERILKEAGAVLKTRAADMIEVVVHRRKSNVVRFAGFVFHQGVTEAGCEIYIRVILGKKIGVASTNALVSGSLDSCLKQALGIAGHVSEEPFSLSLPGPSGYSPVDSYFESTASLTGPEKVSSLSRGFKEAERLEAKQSGSFTTSAGELAVMNTNGVLAYHPYTTAHLSVVSTKGGLSGYKSALAKDVSEVDIPGVMRDSVESCISTAPQMAIEPGVYRALLEPPAVSELMHWLSYIGFGAKNFHEGTSFLSGRLGEKVTGEGVTIYDDGLDQRGMAVPFDPEGSPKRRLPLIEKGVAKGVAYGSFTGAMENRRTTGHAPFPEDTEGPLPGNIFMEGGDTKKDDMLEMLGTGILVKSFHYVNGLLNPKKTVMTGMTRHGTFLVEDGRIRCPVNPLRFTENILEAFKRIEGISKEVEVFQNNSFALSSIAVPHLLIDKFNFSS